MHPILTPMLLGDECIGTNTLMIIIFSGSSSSSSNISIINIIIISSSSNNSISIRISITIFNIIVKIMGTRSNPTFYFTRPPVILAMHFLHLSSHLHLSGRSKSSDVNVMSSESTCVQHAEKMT